MFRSRRRFLATASLSLLSAAAAPKSRAQNPNEEPAGEPPAFGTGPGVGPEVSTQTFAEAEKLVQFELHPRERAQAASSWRKNMASLYERRTGPRKLQLESTLAPATRWNPILSGEYSGPDRDQFVRSKADPGPLPAKDEDIAFASVTQ